MDEAIAELESDKATFELTAEQAGTTEPLLLKKAMCCQ
jgi:pyruvate/2-oxoglutarate dehydrogenase complex dihydrolipoamide acyltransferase (E2) component